MCKSFKLISLFLLMFTLVSINSVASDVSDDSSNSKAIDKYFFKGKVVDRKGNALAGAIVQIKGSNVYSTTDINGFYSLKSEHLELIVLVSYMGYKNHEETILRNKESLITLEEDINLLEEIVILGYGAQKRSSVSGAVEKVSGAFISNRPVPNLSRGLQGIVPNLNITMYDGNPSRSPAYNIRGITSIGSGGEALILIDGTEGDPNMLNTNDIESITVIKDASAAAIYGARGSYGVVLISTKKPAIGKDPEISYSGNITVNSKTINPELVTDGYVWASHFNEAHKQWYGQNPTAINSAFPFSQEYLAELKKRNEDPMMDKIAINPTNGRYIYYDSFDWENELYKKRSYSTEHNLRVSKNDDNTSYYLSGRYYNQEGIYKYNSDIYTTYNLRGKGSIRVNDWLEFKGNFDHSSMEYKEPLYYGGWGFTSEISMGWSMRAFPVSPMLNPDKSITEMGARSIGDLYYGKNKAVTNKRVFKSTVGFKANILENILSLNGDFTRSHTNSNKTRAYNPVPYSNIPNETNWLGNSRYFDHRTDIDYISANLYSSLNLIMGKGVFNLISGINIESSSLKYQEVSRDGLLISDKPGFSLSTGNNYNTIQNVSEWNSSGVFARINYEYDNRYYAEINGRYDGSSKFPKNQRWGYFPSFSTSWKISEENFWNINPRWVNLLKLRGSAGTMGNGNVNPYLYLESMPVSISSKIINGNYPTTTNNPNVIPDGLTWEKTTTLNLGLDLSMLKNSIIATLDIYSRKTTDMFTTGSALPAVFGAEVPKGNYADLITKGWELSLLFNNSFNKSQSIKYSLKLMLSDNVSDITKYNNPTKILSDYYEGMVLGEIWGYETEGLFKDQQDIDNHVSQSRFKSNNAGIVMPGDIKFRNLNSDDEISPGSNTVDDSGDRKIIGNSLPRYNYGINLDLSWKNLSMNMFWQGVGKRDWYPSKESYYFWGQYNRPYSPLPKDILDNYYNSDPANPNLNAYFPRYSGVQALTSSGALNQVQTRYLQDASYIRLKNISIVYNFPEKIASKINADKLSAYITGQNLLTFSALFKHGRNIDPETIESINPDTGNSAFGGGNGYPIQKSITLGINLTF